MSFRVGVVADTHGKIDNIVKVLADEKLDFLFFAGDYYADGQKIAKKIGVPCYAVPGNCDFGYDQPLEMVITLGGHRFLLLHGHQYGVKHDLNKLYYRGKETDVSAVVFGHTHIPLVENLEGMWMVNPGSPSFPRTRGKGTYAVIAVNQKTLIPCIAEM